MRTMTAIKFKNALIKGTHFRKPITLDTDLRFDRDIDLEITTLPNNLSVKYINFRTSQITSLPSSLNVGELLLQFSKITQLPNDLSVEYLWLNHSQINHIPKTIKNIKKISVDENFLLSISFESFLNCLCLFKNIINIISESKDMVHKQFEQRLLLGE